jgi:DNA-binding NarL/FixJ family response regulator
MLAPPPGEPNPAPMSNPLVTVLGSRNPALKLLGSGQTPEKMLTPPAAELRRMAAEGHVDQDAAECVLATAGHLARPRPRTPPAGMTGREVEVLRLAATGLTTAQIARQLVISPQDR